ncbi:alpha/beta fold hydrolase [Marihabitans asiaticum]|uniref:alpha/beta fold hydrolase n=1 Tax=Marihabitans asiaticum TaxID=415218 RepID=UPI0024821509|nr:alpha/beta fold hydrolase [Marihabitans asiaticum]
MARYHRVIAPDLAGFGFTECPVGTTFDQGVWLQQVVDLLDALEVARVHVVGNSFGGSMALALAIDHPDRVDRLVLMGSVGVPFEITDGLDRVWGFDPDRDDMGELMRNVFAYDDSLITEELVASRQQASMRPRTRAAFSAMFPEPRQRWVDAMAHDEASIRAIKARTLVVHGRDDNVIPLQNSLTLLDWIDDSRLHVFGRCGHWTQVEHSTAFTELLLDFFAE